MTGWFIKLIAVLESETVDSELLAYVDDILSWEVFRNEEDSYIELLGDLGQLSIDVRYEEFLDRLIVGDDALGQMFSDSLSDVQAKKRYRKLIRVFHPDRGYKPEEWLNYRAEKINLAYQLFLERDMKADVSIDYSTKPNFKSDVDDLGGNDKKFRPKFKYRPSVWRERLGTPQEFQKKILSVLLAISLLLVVFVYWSNKGASQQAFESSISLSSKFQIDKDFNVDNKEVGVYVKDLNAKKILQEADAFLEGNNIGEFEVDATNLSFIVENKVEVSELEVALDQIVSELENANLSIFKEGVNPNSCHSYKDLASSVLKNKKAHSPKLLTKLALRSGPAIKCEVLVVLASGSQVYFESKTEDNLWAKVLVEPSRKILGWADMKELNLSITKQSVAKRTAIKETIKIEPQKKELNEGSRSLVKTQSMYKVPTDLINKQGGVVESEVLNASGPKVVEQNLSKLTGSKPVYLKLVEDLKNFYEEGDSSKMSELYISSGRENEIRSADKIRKYYRKAFARTVNRKFDYVVESYLPEEESTVLVKGRMDLSMELRKTGQINTIDALFTIRLINLGTVYKIVSFEWRRR